MPGFRSASIEAVTVRTPGMPGGIYAACGRGARGWQDLEQYARKALSLESESILLQESCNFRSAVPGGSTTYKAILEE